jgi:hypothetical protein
MLRSKMSQLLVATVFSAPTVGWVATLPALANDYYGAIAYSRSTGSHGYSYDYATSQAAELAALRGCESYSGTGDCQSLVVFQNACGALAQAANNAAGSGWGVDRTTAERYALESCSEVGSSCRVVRWVCTSRDY